MNCIICLNSNSTLGTSKCISYSRLFMVCFINIVFFFTNRETNTCTTKQARFFMTIHTGTISNIFICAQFYLTASGNRYSILTQNLSRLTCYILSTCNSYIFTTYCRTCYRCACYVINSICTFTFY